MVSNKSFIFKKVPTHAPVPGTHIAIETRQFDLAQDAPDGGAVVRGLYFSLDPYMRGRMHGPEIKSYAPPYELDKPIVAYALAQIIKSAHPKVKAGEVVFGRFEVAEYSVADRDALDWDQTTPIQNTYGVPLSNFLGILGMTGMTAYSSLYEIGQPKKGETIFVSSAAGAVGQIVGQIAKHEGLKVIGSVGDDAKLDFILNDLGFDAGFNYKKEKAGEALKRLAPQGVDIYYENVGGEQLEAALDNMNRKGRIGIYSSLLHIYIYTMMVLMIFFFFFTVACGMISQYNLPAGMSIIISNIIFI